MKDFFWGFNKRKFAVLRGEMRKKNYDPSRQLTE